MLLRGRSVAYLIITMVLAAGIVTNLTFKSLWGRPRPGAVVEFNGPHPYRHWWQAGGACPKNCSFFSGEAATAFWTYAPASLTPPAWRPFAYAGATLFGLATGGLRVAFGGHFVSDVIVAGLVTFFLVWLVHGLIYRWPSTRTTDARIEAWLTWFAWPGYSFMRRKLGARPTRVDPDRVRAFSPTRIHQAEL
jgi:membrane-associated PAP2 superfamily phosphatase